MCIFALRLRSDFCAKIEMCFSALISGPLAGLDSEPCVGASLQGGRAVRRGGPGQVGVMKFL